MIQGINRKISPNPPPLVPGRGGVLMILNLRHPFRLSNLQVMREGVDRHIIHELYLKYRKDKRIIRAIVYHPILFTKRKIVDENDWRPIRIRYFGAFLPKNPNVIKEK